MVITIDKIDVLEIAFQRCFENRQPKDDECLFIFYLAVCESKKAVQQAAASILMECEGKARTSFLNYKLQIEKSIDELYEAYKTYVRNIKGFHDECEYLTWVRYMDEKNMEVQEFRKKCKDCVMKLHPFIFKKVS